MTEQDEQRIKLKIRQSIAKFFTKVGKKLKLIRQDDTNLSQSSWGFKEPEAPFEIDSDDELMPKLNESVDSEPKIPSLKLSVDVAKKATEDLNLTVSQILQSPKLKQEEESDSDSSKAAPLPHMTYKMDSARR